MAYADYYHCDVCDAKCFYDSNLNWEWDEPDTINVEDKGMSLDNCGAIKALCLKCVQTHKIMIELK